MWAYHSNKDIYFKSSLHFCFFLPCSLFFLFLWLFTSLQYPFCNENCDFFFVCCIVHITFFYLEQAVLAIVLAVLTVVLVNIPSTAEPALILSLRKYSPTEVLWTNCTDSFNVYEELVRNEGSSVKNPGKPINHALMEIAEKNTDYSTQYIVAAECNDSNPFSLNAMYSSTAFHSAPISLNLLTNAILKSTDAGRSITVINHPLVKKQVRW